MVRAPLAHVLAVGLALTATSGSASEARSSSATLVTRHPAILASLQRIAAGSTLWRDAVAAVGRSGRRVHLVTPDDVVAGETPQDTPRKPFDPDLLAEVAPVSGEDARVDTVLVVINVALIEEAHRRHFLPPIELSRDLDRIVVHEVYGHALPYLLAGHLSGRCADPLPNQRAADACAIQRENAVRAELGLGRRTDYGLDGLGLARRAAR